MVLQYQAASFSMHVVLDAAHGQRRLRPVAPSASVIFFTKTPWSLPHAVAVQVRDRVRRRRRDVALSI